MKRSFTITLLVALLALIVVRYIPFPFPTNKKSPNVIRILVTHKGKIGDIEMAQRIKRSAVDMQLECGVLSLARAPSLKRLVPSFNKQYVKHFNPDIVISLSGDKLPRCDAFQFVALAQSSSHYFSPHSPTPMQSLIDFDAFLVSFPDHQPLETFCSFLDVPCRLMSWFPTCAITPFNPVQNFNLIYYGSNFENTIYGAGVRTLFSQLEHSGYFNIYGAKENWLHTPNSYRGLIPQDGKSVIRVIHNCGIALIIHSPCHYEGGTPSSRLFEACAACAIIISDNNPFVKSEFGDSVLYFDAEKSIVEVCQQIEAHMKWIRSHRDEAQALAKKSHRIFVEKFSLEAQLEHLISFYKEQRPDKEKPTPQLVESGPFEKENLNEILL